jgi:hypothetical protein
MKLPNGDKARIPEEKILGYLLSTDHPIGRFKARFFAGLGFTTENWDELRGQLRELAKGEATLGPATGFGQKYLVLGTLEGPAGAAEVVTVWIVLTEDDTPRFVTVYPR